MANIKSLELKPKDLRWVCDPTRLGFETTDDLTCKPHIIGQDRALDAMQLGLELGGPGYNIFISGVSGSGKLTAIRRVLESMDLRKSDLADICFLYNFKQPESPHCLSLAAGHGRKLQEQLKELLTTVREVVPTVFEGDAFKTQQSRIVADVKARRTARLEELEHELTAKGFSLIEVEYGPYTRPDIVPVIAGETVAMDQLPALLASGKIGRGDYKKMQEQYPLLMEKLDEFLLVNRDLQHELDQRIDSLQREHIQPLLAFALEEFSTALGHNPEVDQFLGDLAEFVLNNLLLFAHDPSESGIDERLAFLPFEVNVLVDNADTTEAPVVIETAPTFVNLFGTIDRMPEVDGRTIADFTRIRAGSLLRANGGYLVVSLDDILEEPQVWPTLKRALKYQRSTIQSFDSFLMRPVASLSPEPIVFDVKVVLIGDEHSFSLLSYYEEDFSRIFKVKSEFDSVMPNSRTNQKKYAQFVKNICEEESLLPFHKSAVAALIEQGVRLAGRQDRMTTKFGFIGDMAREASYWAKKEKAKEVGDSHVVKAVDHRFYRVSLFKEKVHEQIYEGTILMDVKGSKVGQVNGLSVYDIGEASFGKPARITAEIGVGRSGVTNIERESELSGRTHNKGVLILEGYLRRQYAQDKPLTMNASICFEQSYGGIDGDSASSTELYALLSSLSGLPLRQDVAVTGSVNQKGEIQPIGGVNEKIEGFYDVCVEAGLTGTQGVMIPRTNKVDLMLRPDVVEAITNGKFNVWAIATIDQGIEILMQTPAGRPLKNGGFTKGSVHDQVDATLREFAAHLTASESGDE